MLFLAFRPFCKLEIQYTSLEASVYESLGINWLI